MEFLDFTSQDSQRSITVSAKAIMKTVGDLLDENIIQILSYLRATDLASSRASNQRVFSGERVHAAIEMLVKEVYNLPSHSPVKKAMMKLYYEKALKRPDYLFSKELLNITTALSSQPPVIPSTGETTDRSSNLNHPLIARVFSS
jgi:hypothetical protein